MLIFEIIFVLYKLDRWCCCNKLVINAIKTKWMLFTNKRNVDVPDIRLSDAVIERVDAFKYLGFTLDTKLSFRLHIDNLSNKLSRLAGIVYCLLKYISVKTARTIYYSFVYSILTYGISTWGEYSCVPLLRDYRKNKTK
jgi:hypothetical protein